MSWKDIVRFVLALLVASPAQGGDLNMIVTGLRSDTGALMIGLYDNAERFSAAIANAPKIGLLSDKGRLVGVTMRARAGAQGVGFLQLPPGRYAVIVFHDENDSGVLDKSFWGIPKEGYGFGNNATGFLAAPSFNAAAITIGDSNQIVAIPLVYPVQ